MLLTATSSWYYYQMDLVLYMRIVLVVQEYCRGRCIICYTRLLLYAPQDSSFSNTMLSVTNVTISVATRISVSDARLLTVSYCYYLLRLTFSSIKSDVFKENK